MTISFRMQRPWPTPEAPPSVEPPANPEEPTRPSSKATPFMKPVEKTISKRPADRPMIRLPKPPQLRNTKAKCETDAVAPAELKGLRFKTIYT